MTSPVIEEAVEFANDIEEGIQDFFNTVNNALDRVPGFLEYLIQPIMDGLDQLTKAISEFWAEAREFLDNTGSPSKLQAHSEALISNVVNPLSDIAGTIAPEKLATATEWTGSGAEAYKQVIPSQVNGVGGLKDLATELANTLKELANGIENFWIAMGIALAALAVEIAAAIAGGLTIVGIPVAIGVILVALPIAIGAIGTAIMEIKGIYDTIDTSQDTIDQGVTKLGEEWAKATPENQAKIDDGNQWEPL